MRKLLILGAVASAIVATPAWAEFVTGTVVGIDNGRLVLDSGDSFDVSNLRDATGVALGDYVKVYYEDEVGLDDAHKIDLLQGSVPYLTGSIK